MPYEIDVDSTVKVIRVKHEGPVDIDEMRVAREETAQHVADSKFKRILVDIRNATLDSTIEELFGFSISYRDLLKLDVRIAIVYSMENVAREDILFAETVARNRGVVKRIFTDEKESLDWLESS